MSKLSDCEFVRTNLGVGYYGDCLDLLPAIKDKVDLVITDLPYGIEEVAYRKNTPRSKLTDTKNYHQYEERKIKGIEDILQDKNKYDKLIIFGGQCYNFNPNYGWIIWDKDNGDSSFSDCELAYTNFLNAARKYTYRWNGMIQEHMGRLKQDREHPHEKPLILFKWLLKDFVKKGQLILDCCGGSGIAAVAAESMNINWIYIDSEIKYCDITKRRVEAEASQIKMGF